MPSSYAELYFPVLLQALLAMAVAGGMLAFSALLGKRARDRVKASPYECGMIPVGSPRERFSVKYYLVAMVFILLDVEAVFLYPWAVVYRELRMLAFVEMALFLGLILAGFYYFWKKGALEWSREDTSEKAETANAA